MKNNTKIIKYVFAVLISFSLIFFGLQRLLVPKYVDASVEGRLIAEYYEDNHSNQVIFIGDCEVYENFTPVTFWEEFGITSYIRGGPQQLIWQSYYLLEEMLHYEVPEVVVFNVLSMKYGTPQNEAYNRLNLDGMRWSSSKWDAIQVSMMENESELSYFFPVFRYHDRVSELTGDDFKYYFGTDPLSHNGYLMQTGIKGVGVIPQGDYLANTEFEPQSYEYLDKIRDICAEYGVDLVLVKAPTVYPYWYEEWDAQMVDYAVENDLLYLNFLDISDEIGIDFSVDTYDAGLHLNVYGAEKLSLYFGEILQNEYQLPDQRGDKELSAIWDDKIEAYYNERNA